MYVATGRAMGPKNSCHFIIVVASKFCIDIGADDELGIKGHASED